MRESANILKVSELKPDIIGFIFYPQSPRFAGEKPDQEMLSKIPSSVIKAGVFVNADEDAIKETAAKYSLKMIQLHGDESPELCRRLKEQGFSVIKAFGIDSFTKCRAYASVTDYFLFDSPATGYGGSGKKFNWGILDDFDTDHPFFLSGGISYDDADRIKAIRNHSLYGVDLNSRFETEPGIKDIELLKNFISGIRKKTINNEEDISVG